MKWVYDPSLITRQIIAWAVLLGIWGAIIYLVIRYVPGQFVAIVLGIIAIPIIIQFFFSDKIVLKSMGARIITESDDPRLYNMIRKLAKQANLPMPKVALVNTTMPNAFATGRSKHHSVVAVTRGIYSYLNDDEFEAVIAHELSHVKNSDMATMTISSFLSTVAMLLLMGLAFGAEANSNTRNENLLFALGKLVFFLLAFLIAGALYLLTIILTMLISRYRELAADRGSVLITGSGKPLIRALQKIEQGVAVAPSHALPKSSSCNLYYIVPAAVGFSIFNLFSTHPTLEKRIRNIENFERRQQSIIRNNQKTSTKIPPASHTQLGMANASKIEPVIQSPVKKGGNLGERYFNQALENLIGTETLKPNIQKGNYYLNKARELNNSEAISLLSNSDREAAIYLAGARHGNEIAWQILQKWHRCNKDRLSQETWHEIGRIKKL